MELVGKLGDAIADFQFEETMRDEDAADTLVNVKDDEVAYSEVALALKGHAQHRQLIPYEYLRDEYRGVPFSGGSIRKKMKGDQPVALKKLNQQESLPQKAAILSALSTCENIEKL